MTDAEIAALQGLLAQHRGQIDRSSGQSYFQKQGDMDFHFRIFEGSKNSRLINLYCNDLYQLIRLYRCQFGMVSKRVPQAFKEHEQIVAAIRQRDGELAEFLMLRHIRVSQRNVETMLAGETGAGTETPA
jgi:DNA-binding GntR family transcriptional regulator